ncbi:MAG TPA: DUF4214 domain-containing protein [Burkholderiaceae bacterium]
MSTASLYDNLVQELYIAYFGRPVDYFGLQNFDQALATAKAPAGAVDLLAAYASNPALKSLVDAFGASHESTTLYGSASTQDFVNAIFKDLFNRPAAAAGLSFWSSAIDSGQVGKGLAALDILAGAQQNTSAQGIIDQQAMANKVTVAENFTIALGASSSQIVAYAGATAAEDARMMLASVNATTNAATFDVQTTINVFTEGPPGPHIYNLTTTPETLVGGAGNNVFDAILDNTAGLAAGGQAQTLLAGDSIIGGTLENILNIADFGIGSTMTIPSGVTFVGITTLNVNSLESVSGDFSTWKGLANLNILSSAGHDAIVAGNATAVMVKDNLGNVSVQGGTNVSAATDKAHAVALSSSSENYFVTVGDSSNTVTDLAVDASVSIVAGGGANTVALGPGASGTISLAAHIAADVVVLAPSEANSKSIVVVSGLNNSGSDAITFSGDVNTLAGFTQVASAAVTGSGGDTASLAAWVRAADGAQGSGVAGAAHTVTWFVFQGNTYLLESVAGPTADAGTMAAGNTLVELTGTGYTFAHASGANGTLHLQG